MMIQEFAHMLCEELKANPTKSNIANVTNKILKATVDGQPITAEKVEEILSCMQEELGDYVVLTETFDNQATLSVMAEVRKLIAASQASGSSSTKGTK